MAPHSGLGGCTPRPTKLRAEIIIILPPMLIVVLTMMGARQLGMILERRIRMVVEPETRAELENILTFANRAASLTCSRSGAIPAMPTLAELKGCLE